MSKTNHPIEKLVKTIIYKGVEFEVVERPDVICVGCVDYANNNTDEADTGAIFKRFQELVESVPIEEKINPDWWASLSINYSCDDKPRGFMCLNESYTEKQDSRYDLFILPGGLWLRVCNDKKAAELLLGKETANMYEYFAGEEAPLQSAAKENGYKQNPDIHIQVEYWYNNPPHTNYAYIPIIAI